jgi:anti-sigma regulatory factor (Ser/Thr protein kinase)
MGANGELELTLDPAPASIAKARARVLDAVGGGLAAEARQTLCLLVSEVVTNAIRHGGTDRPVRLRASCNGDVRVEVIDHGDGFIPRPRHGDLEDPGGFGLYLVGRLADRWGVETAETTCVWFELGQPARAG